MNPQTVLVCTVGGSHQPIIRAIKESHADLVCFICTGPDPGTGKSGSDVQIEGKGMVVKANLGDEKPTLPNIPTQCGLKPGQYELRRVPADDLDSIYAACRNALNELRHCFPTAKVLADYTGGTKTMTAALVLAALEDDRIELQLVTGNRVDLVKVRDGAEAAAPANIEEIRLERNMQPYLGAWSRFAYAESDHGLRALPTPMNSTLRSRLNRARDLSAAFAAWDRFDHVTAMDKLKDYASTLSQECSALLGILRSLTEKEPLKRQAAQLLDLYLNAERRASQGRYDDAVARLYRLLEWSAQWLLERYCQVKTSDLPEKFAPHIQPNRDGRRQAGLFEAWRLICEKTSGPMANFIREQEERLLDHLRARNGSILAHGFEPLGKDAWDAFEEWVTNHFVPVLLQETSALGIRKIPPQLPVCFPNARQP